VRLPDYAIVSPVKDEAAHLLLTARSVLAQTHPPVEWVIVDDGSTDGTRELAESLAEREPWISVIETGSGDARARGAPVVRAFNAGRATLSEPHDFVVKLDGDLFLPSHYFEWVAATFGREERAGVVGGRVLVHDDGEWVPERIGRHTVHGAIKAYRVACLDSIGGLCTSMGWDGIDEYAAKARGWNVIPLGELTVLHYRKRGSKQRWWRARVEEGRGAHYMGYLPAFVLVRAAYRMLVEPPPLLGGLALLAGWLGATLCRAPIVDDPLAVAALRTEQRGRLRRLISGGRVEPGRPEAGGPALWALDPAKPPAAR
jgi:biofilm PGA synthesis N-glycosyltransferase PgaC